MLDDSPGRRRPATEQAKLTRWGMVRADALGVLLATFMSIVLLVDFLPSNQILLNAGDVSPTDILAPYDLTYESEIRTSQAQVAQAASVQDIYDPPDASVARQQEVQARQILDYISTVRADVYAPLQQRADWIAAIPDLSLSPTVISQTLTLGEDDWQQIKDETVRVLIRAMQGEIRDSQVAAVRRRLPTLISTNMTDDQATVVEAIAGGLVRANTFYNAARTEEAKQQARDSTEPIKVTVREGEAIVRQGSLVATWISKPWMPTAYASKSSAGRP